MRYPACPKASAISTISPSDEVFATHNSLEGVRLQNCTGNRGSEVGRIHKPMKSYVRSLTVHWLTEHETVSFAAFNYLHGPIGAGKTTIAKLIDFCLGDRFSPRPVLQSIFVSVSLNLVVGSSELILTVWSSVPATRPTLCPDMRPRSESRSHRQRTAGGPETTAPPTMAAHLIQRRREKTGRNVSEGV
jgi:hypothetical protein